MQLAMLLKNQAMLLEEPSSNAVCCDGVSTMGSSCWGSTQQAAHIWTECCNEQVAVVSSSWDGHEDHTKIYAAVMRRILIDNMM